MTTRAKPGPKKKAITEKKDRNKLKAATNGADAKIIQRQTWVLELRRKGASYAKIAKRLIELKLVQDTYGEGLAYKDYRDAIGRVLMEQQELAQENLRLDLERLDEMLMKVWPQAVPPTDPETGVSRPPDLFSIGTVMQLLSARAKLLNYEALYKKPDEPKWVFNVDWSRFSTEEILLFKRRFMAGEEPVVILAEIEQARQANSQLTPGS